MSGKVSVYNLPARILHWSMAFLLVLMLFVGAGMVSNLEPWQPTLVGWHKRLGLLLLALAALRLLVRLTSVRPDLPHDLPGWQRRLARAMHWALYAAMFALPLLGWAMQSAAGYPLRLGDWLLPPLLGEDAGLYGVLRAWHGWLAYGLFAMVLAHLGAALVHGLIRRDTVLASMWRGR